MELDPRSVRALVGLAEALIDSVSVGSEDPSAPMKFRWADELTRRAELLRPDDAYVMYVRLYLLGKEWRWSEAIPAAQRAIEIHPSMPGAHLWLGMCLMRDGRAADAIVKFKEALRLRPRSPYNYNRYRIIGEALIFWASMRRPFRGYKGLSLPTLFRAPKPAVLLTRQLLRQEQSQVKPKRHV